MHFKKKTFGNSIKNELLLLLPLFTMILWQPLLNKKELHLHFTTVSKTILPLMLTAHYLYIRNNMWYVENGLNHLLRMTS